MTSLVWASCSPNAKTRPAFPDDVTDVCATCQAPIVYRRSQVPPNARCICIPCAMARVTRVEEMEF